MKIDPLPRMRTSGPEICFVIMGDGPNAGGIKSVRYGSGVNSEILHVSTNHDDSGKPYHELHCSPQYASRGWRVLYDQFMAEDGDDARYFDFVQFHHAAVRGRVHVDAEDDSIVAGLPDYMLPQYCRDKWSRSKDPMAGKWVPPKPPQDKESAKRASSTRKAQLG